MKTLQQSLNESLNEAFSSAIIANIQKNNPQVMNQFFRSLAKYRYSVKGLQDDFITEVDASSAVKKKSSDIVKLWMKGTELVCITVGNALVDETFNWNSRDKGKAIRNNDTLIGNKDIINSWIVKGDSYAIKTFTKCFMIAFSSLKALGEKKQPTEKVTKDEEIVKETSTIDYEKLLAWRVPVATKYSSSSNVEKKDGVLKKGNIILCVDERSGQDDPVIVEFVNYQKGVIKGDGLKMTDKFRWAIVNVLNPDYSIKDSNVVYARKILDRVPYLVASDLKSFKDGNWLSPNYLDTITSKAEKIDNVIAEYTKDTAVLRNTEEAKGHATRKKIQAEAVKISRVILANANTWKDVIIAWRKELHKLDALVTKNNPYEVDGIPVNSSGSYYAYESSKGKIDYRTPFGMPGMEYEKSYFNDDYVIKKFNAWINDNKPKLSDSDALTLCPRFCWITSIGNILGDLPPAVENFLYSQNDGKNKNGTVKVTFKKTILAYDAPSINWCFK